MKRSDLKKKQLANTSTTVNTSDSMETQIVVEDQNIYIQGPISTATLKDHAALDNLDYENSGHTGFASKQDVNQKITISAETTSLSSDVINTLENNASAVLVYDNKVYNLSVRNGNLRTYINLNEKTNEISTITFDTQTGECDITTQNPICDDLSNHIKNTSVHLQSGERNF